VADTNAIGSWSRRVPATLVLRLIPTTAVVAFVWVLAWDTQGGIVASDWEPYAAATALLLGAVLVSGTAVRPGRAALAAAGLLAGFAAWSAITIDWSPLPAGARDDALLAIFYAVAFLVPLVTLRAGSDRQAAVIAVTAGLATIAVATLADVRFSASPEDRYLFQRLVFPISYTNGEAAFALIGFWPAVALASSRTLPALVRALSLGGATAMLSCFLMTQSKGGSVALAASGVVFFALCPKRLRVLVPVAIAAALAGAGVAPLTEPYRAGEAAFADAVRDAGGIGLVLTAAGVAVGLLYVLADRRIDVPATVRRSAGRVISALLVAAVLAGIAVFFVRVDHPVRFAQEKWDNFKRLPTNQTTGTHFTSLGSNRYDFWRVALDEFADHPLAGTGSRGWAVAYLQHGRSVETPERAHSVEADALSETGIVGFLLLAGSGVLALFAVGRRARGSPLAASLLAVGVYFAVHASVDWIWTMPAVALPAFLLVGIGASPDNGSPLPARAAIPAGVLALVLAVAVFAPPWVSAKLVDRAYEAPDAASASGDLRWARRLDPLSVDPLLAEAALAKPPANLPPLRRAVERQPRDAEVHYLLGLAYLDLGRNAEARRALEAAARLSPRDPAIQNALRRASP
jgi:O-antigen ligase